MKFSLHHCRARLWFSLLVFFLLVVVLPLPVSAQAGDTVILTSMTVEEYPRITFYFETYDESGRFIEDLQPEEIQALEDGAARPLTVLEKFEPGVQFILALNTAPVFLNQAGGVSLYRRIQETLAGWSQSQSPAGAGDYSLVSNTGLQAIRLQDPLAWAQAVMEYQPDLLTLQPSQVSLSQALDLATDPNPSPLMKRAILYVTGLPASTQVAALPNMADRAAQLGVRIYVWLVGSPELENTVGGDALRQMAERTGGNLVVYSGLEQLPDIDLYLQPLRYIYKASFESAIRESGSHRLSVQVNHSNLQSTSQERVFDLTVLPPNPILISPPTQVQRTWSEPASKKEEARLEPGALAVPFMVEFPDGHIRPLVRARLVVDGKEVVEKTEPPFEVLAWPLQEYSESGKHMLLVEVEDQLGFQSKTIEVPIEMVVEPAPRRGFFNGLISPERLAIAAAVLTATVILVAVLITAGRRLQPSLSGKNRKTAKDPLTQPVIIKKERFLQRSSSAAADVKTLKQPAVPARFVRMIEEGYHFVGGDIALSNNDITFGSDAKLAIVFLDDPSVGKIHARLHRSPEGKYIIMDAGSLAGTWVNYNPVSALGVPLNHGDLVHIGRVAYRFELSNPGEIPPPAVALYREEKP